MRFVEKGTMLLGGCQFTDTENNNNNNNSHSDQRTSGRKRDIVWVDGVLSGGESAEHCGSGKGEGTHGW